MKRSLLSSITFSAALMIGAPAGAETIKLTVDRGQSTSKVLGYGMVRACKFVLPVDCSFGASRLGMLTVEPKTVAFTGVNKASLARCMDGKNGHFGGMSSYTTLEATFVAGASYGFQQITMNCKRTDNTTSQTILHISVETEK